MWTYSMGITTTAESDEADGISASATVSLGSGGKAGRVAVRVVLEMGDRRLLMGTVGDEV